MSDAPKNSVALVRAELMAPAMTAQFQMALPPHVKVERFQRVIVTAVQQNMDLLNCDRRSLFGECMKAAQLGLLTDGFLGEAYLICGYTKAGKVAQMRVGYKGLMKLARQSGEISNIYAEAVFSNDRFKYALGLNRTLVHVPEQKGPRGDLTHVYAVAKWRDGSDPDFIVMTRAEIEEVRDTKSDGWKAYKANKIKSTPWATDFVPMAKKTAIRALCKLLPQSPDLNRALKIEDSADRGVPTRIEDGEIIAEAEVVEIDPHVDASGSLDAFDEAAEENGAPLAIEVAEPETNGNGHPPAAARTYSEADHDGWRQWCRKEAAAIAKAKTTDDLDAWLSKKNGTLGDCKDWDQEQYGALMQAANARRNAIQSEAM